jgi:hypothetical protein
MPKIENSLGSIRLWVAKRRHDGLTDGLGLRGMESDVYAENSGLEDARPQWHCIELLDGSVGATGRGACECTAIENFTRR